MSVSNRRARSHSPVAKSPHVANYSFHGPHGDSPAHPRSIRSGHGSEHGGEGEVEKLNLSVGSGANGYSHGLEDSGLDGAPTAGGGGAVGSNMSLASGDPATDQVAVRASLQKQPEVIGSDAWPDTRKIQSKDILPAMVGKKLGKLDGKVLAIHDDYYLDEANIDLLQEGGSLFSFTWRQPKDLTNYEKLLIDSVINLSSFADERENGTELFDVYDAEEVKKYSYLVQKSAYILPGMRLMDVDPKWLASYEYMSKCQPASCYIWEDNTEENTFRLTKTIIRFIFSVTMQFKLSRVQSPVLPHLSQVLGIRVDAAILLERTRRTANAKPDQSAKTKSLLCYTKVEGGLLVTNYTIALQYSVPAVVTKLINSFGGRGLDEVNETAARTRTFLAATLKLDDGDQH